jgi:hypothetical protein
MFLEILKAIFECIISTLKLGNEHAPWKLFTDIGMEARLVGSNVILVPRDRVHYPCIPVGFYSSHLLRALHVPQQMADVDQTVAKVTCVMISYVITSVP